MTFQIRSSPARISASDRHVRSFAMHQLEDLQPMLAALAQQLVAGVERIRRQGMQRSGRRRLALAHDEAAADRVDTFSFAQRLAVRAERGESHAVRVLRQPLGAHEQQLHRLVERDLVLTEQLDAPGRAECAGTVGSMLSGSTVSGSAPSRPSSTARSVPCPAPVNASEP